MSQNSSTELSLDKALEKISQVSIPFPKSAVEALLGRKEEVQPFLLDEVKKAIEPPSNMPKGYMMHLYSIFMLAHFKNKDLFPLIIKLMYLPVETIDHVFGEDFIASYDVPNIIASTFNGDLAPIYQVFENKSLNDYIRSSAIRGILALAVTNQIKKEDVSDYLLLLMEKNKLEDESPYLWAIVTGLVMDLYLHELVPFISESFDNDSIDENYTDIEHFIDHFESESEGYDKTMSNNHRCYHFIDAIDDMSWWACFKTKKEQREEMEKLNKLLKDLPTLFDESPLIKTNKKNIIKIGRNDPCHCGSGKKYKKCCLPGPTLRVLQ